MKKLLLSLAAAAMGLAVCAQTASYELPATLSYYGTITQEEGIPFPAANYVTTNPINDGAFIWVPVGSKILFKNSSEGEATAYKWDIPGGVVDDVTAKNVIVTYSKVGTYDFPTLTASYGENVSEFKHNLKIKVGGQAELCHSDTREWGETYGLGYAPFQPQSNGALGGSNKVNIAGVGNFYRFSSPDMFVDAVNVYATHRPEKADKDAKVKVLVYLPFLGDSNFSMIGQFGSIGALDFDMIPMSEGKVAADGVYLPVKSYAVYTLNMATPMRCEGYPYLFFAVEGFAYNPNAATLEEDFVIATDVMPNRELEIEDYSNAMSHNSFARLANESDYIRPITTFGGVSMNPLTGKAKSFNFWICPMVRGAETPYSGIKDIIADCKTKEISLQLNSSELTVTGASDGVVELYDINGIARISAVAANGGAVFNISGLAGGVYIVRTSDGASAKFVK